MVEKSSFALKMALVLSTTLKLTRFALINAMSGIEVYVYTSRNLYRTKSLGAL